MPLLKNDNVVEDTWTVVGDEEKIPADGGAIITLERWQRERESLLGRNAPLGLTLNSSQSPEKVEGLSAFALIRLEFPAFTDGRAYSYARLLRERFGYTGEVRAAGNVLRDQYAHMLRCGFDAFEIDADTDPDEWVQSRDAVGLAYQNATDGVRAVWAKRHGRAA